MSSSLSNNRGTDELRICIFYALKIVRYSFFSKFGPGCSKLTTSLVKVSLKFQTLISEICQYFLLKKREKLLQSLIFSTKISVFLVIKL